MKKLLIYLKDYKKESILAPIFKLLEASFELIIPFIVAAIIDKGIVSKDKRYVGLMCLLMIGLGVAGLIASITAQYFAAKASAGFAKKIRHVLFSHIQTLSFSEIDVVGTSTMITRMTSDINQVQAGLNIFLRLFLRSISIVLGSMIMALLIDAKASIIFIIVIPLLFLIVFGVMYVTVPLYKKVQNQLDNVLRITRESLTGVRVIRAFTKEDEELEEFNKNNQNLLNLQIYAGKISAVLNPVTYVVINGAIVILIWKGAIRVNGGYLTQGTVVALVNYMSQILLELIKLVDMIMSVIKSIASGNRIQSLLAIQSSMKESENGDAAVKQVLENKDKPILQFENVSLTYQNSSEESLTNINFLVNQGQTVGIIGDTGSGKSSLINLIPRFYEATKGNVFYHGVNVKELPIKFLRGKIGMVMQKSVLFQGTIRDNLYWGKEGASYIECMRALELAQAKEFVQEQEDGLNTWIEQAGKNFSGGQKQRLSIARAIVRDPELLILDDSASALDYATDAKLRKSIKSMAQSVTTIIVSQRISAIQNADQILVLDDGKLVGCGTHDKLLFNCKVYQEIFSSQNKKEANE